MKKQAIVIGLGGFGASVAKTLIDLGHEVLGIDNSEARVNDLKDYLTHVVIADARDEEVLSALGINNFDVAVIAIGEDIEANILISLMLKDMGIKKVVSKAESSLHGKVLEKIGVDQVVYPERDMGIRIAQSLATTNVLDFIELTEGHRIVEILAPERFIGKTLGNSQIRAKYGVSVIAIKTGKDITVAPGANAEIKESDILVVIGEVDNINKLQM